jgi:outer membrane protein assembly factor BamB
MVTAVVVALALLGGCSSRPSSIMPSHAPQPRPTAPGPLGPTYTASNIPGSEWPEYRRDDERTGDNVNETVITEANVAQLKVKWTQSVFQDFAEPVIVNGIVYVGDSAWHIKAISLATGALLWTFSNPVPLGGGYISTPEYYRGMLYAPAFFGDMSVVAANSGTLAWTYPAISVGLESASSMEASTLIANGEVFEGQIELNEVPGQCATENQFVTYSLSQAAVLGALTTTPSATGAAGAGVWASPMVDPSGNIYVGTASESDCFATSPFPNAPYHSRVLKLTPSGLGVVWVGTPGPTGNVESDNDFGSTPLYINGMVIDGGKDGMVYAYSPTTGKLLWRFDPGFGPPVAGENITGSIGTDGQRLYVPYSVAGTGGAIVAIDLSGHEIWRKLTAMDPMGQGVLSAPAIAQGMLFVGYDDLACTQMHGTNCYRISAIDGATGNILWSYAAPSEIYAGPAIVDGALVVGEFNNSGDVLYCFTLNGQ